MKLLFVVWFLGAHFLFAGVLVSHSRVPVICDSGAICILVVRNGISRLVCLGGLGHNTKHLHVHICIHICTYVLKYVMLAECGHTCKSKYVCGDMYVWIGTCM